MLGLTEPFEQLMELGTKEDVCTALDTGPTLCKVSVVSASVSGYKLKKWGSYFEKRVAKRPT